MARAVPMVLLGEKLYLKRLSGKISKWLLNRYGNNYFTKMIITDVIINKCIEYFWGIMNQWGIIPRLNQY